MPPSTAPAEQLNAIQAPTPAPHEESKGSRAFAMKFLEGTRIVTQDELRDNDITRYQVTKFYQEQIRKSGYHEQLKYIVEPSFQEFQSPGALDTSGEADNTVVPGLQHKYPQTGLLLVTDRCAAYCRYCFRKRIVGNDSDEVAPDYARVAGYIREHPEMQNVLLSGGDSMVLSTEKLHRIMDHLLPLANLTSIRFGTKTIAFYPPRFADPELPGLFERIIAAGKTPVIVAHFDHLGEISDEAVKNIRALRKVGVQFLNQTVLLNRVNNDPDIVAATFARLHDVGVRPYYLFQARPVKAASHFQLSLREGVEIVRAVNARLSGIQKTFKYIMSHVTGKIEILDIGDDGRLYMRYHQNKCAQKIGKIFSRRYVEGASWLDDLPVG
jgi:lysine 2,3-aminomutase